MIMRLPCFCPVELKCPGVHILRNKEAVAMVKKGKKQDAAEKITEEKKEGDAVKDFKIGSTRIRLCDDFCRDKTPADIEAILARISRRAQAQLAVQQQS